MKEINSHPEVKWGSLARIATFGFATLAAWGLFVGGILLMAWGDLSGILAVALGILVSALYWIARKRSMVTSLGASRSLPARVIIANVLLIVLVGVLVYGYASDPYVTYNAKDSQALIFHSIAAVIAVGALVANLVALRKDQQRNSRG